MTNRKLATLLAAACAAPCAWAQTGDPVTLYGRVFVTVESVDAKGDLGTPTAGVCQPPTCVKALPRNNRVSDQASYLGVRGTETLGGGLKAFFQLETQFKPDQNDTTFANRNSGVGLQTRVGSLLIGRWDTPFKWANGNVDPYDDLTIGALESVLQGSGIAGVTGQFDRRDQNVVQYWSPDWGGLGVRLSYSANEGRTATTNPQSQGASVVWKNDNIYVGYAYHELKDQSFGIYTNTAPVQPAVLAIGSVNVGKQTANSVFATLKFGAIKVGLDYQEFKRTSPTLPATMLPGTVVGFEKQKAWLGNIVWTIGNHQLSYQYMKMKDGGQQAFNPAYTPLSPDCDMNAFGWQYNFSRRTFFLMQYVTIKNNATATCTFGQNPLTVNPGQDPQGFSLGLRHIF